MSTIKFISHEGEEHTVEGCEGSTLMNVALDNGVPGIDGDCGGCNSCGTCHVFVAEEWVGKLPPPSTTEEAMLKMRPDRQPNSRLSCQIEVNAELDGLTATLPEFQM